MPSCTPCRSPDYVRTRCWMHRLHRSSRRRSEPPRQTHMKFCPHLSRTPCNFRPAARRGRRTHRPESSRRVWSSGCRAGSGCRGAGCVRGADGGVGGATGGRVGDVLRPEDPGKPAEESQHSDDSDYGYGNHPAGPTRRRISTWRCRRESLGRGIRLRRGSVAQLRRLWTGLRPCLVVRWPLIVVRHRFIARSGASNDKSWFDSIWPANGLSPAFQG